MNGFAPRFARIATGLVVLVALAWVITVHAAKPATSGISLTTDWSHSRLIFSQPHTPAQAARLSRDPRYVQQLHRRADPLRLNGHPATEAATSSLALPAAKIHQGNPRKIIGAMIDRDWQQNLGAGASVGAGNYPAKFSFNSNAANCTSDYVMYSTGLLGTTSQASIVAYNNLYSGCGGGVPSVLWSYNTSIDASTDQILTSPVLSLDGTQVAFVQTTGSPAGQAGIVLLRWAAGPTQTVAAPGTPTNVGAAANYPGCTAPCLTEVFLQDGALAANDSTSSIFYDYSSDTAWVGTALGYLHKFSPFFKGVPTEVASAQIAANLPLLNPVYDSESNQVFVMDETGVLNRINPTTLAATKSAQLVSGSIPAQGPIVDSSNGLIYVFSSGDTSTTCAGGPCSAVYQFTPGFAAGTSGTEVQVGTGTSLTSLVNNPLFIGGFDSAYYNSVDGTGNLYVCGDAGAAPTLYQVPIHSGVLPASGTVLTRLTLAADTPACSAVTDVANPNTTGGPSERLFVSVQSNGESTACANAGCILNFVDAPWQASTTYTRGQQVLVLNHSGILSIETAVSATGTSGTTQPASWPSTAGTTTSDGSVTWLDQGALRATTPSGWLATHNYLTTGARVLDSNHNIEIVTTVGLSGLTVPTWNTTAGGVTVDGLVTWTNAGTTGTFALPAAGGTSGIIIDNVIGAGVLSGTSQVYFSTLSNQTSCGSGGCAVQASQPGLN
jgi:hypothetical protein